MSTVASAAAAGLAKVPDDELIDALALIVSLRPNLQEPMRDLAAQEPSPRHTGTITHFFPEKQYGFIKCDEVKNTYGWDTFLSDLELGPFAVGRTVHKLYFSPEQTGQAAGSAARGGGNSSLARTLRHQGPTWSCQAA